MNVGVIFFIIGTLFAWVGYKIFQRLKLFHSEYFYKHKKKLIIATLGLAIPCILRSISDFIFFYYQGKINQENLYSFYVFSYASGTIRDLIHIFFEFGTLVFGLIRFQKMNEIQR